VLVTREKGFVEAARAISAPGFLGTIEVGKAADLLLVDRDPVADITALGEVSWVMREGRVIPLHPEWRCGAVRDGLAVER
jgi:imidazolonepropionase-like amidohydrolase